MNDHIQVEDFLPLKSAIVAFQGANFDTKVSHSIPMEVLRGNPLPRFTSLTAFLLVMEKHDFFRTQNRKGIVIHIDDQYVNQKQIKGYFHEMKINDKLLTFADGADGIERLGQILVNIKPEGVANLA